MRRRVRYMQLRRVGPQVFGRAHEPHRAWVVRISPLEQTNTCPAVQPQAGRRHCHAIGRTPKSTAGAVQHFWKAAVFQAPQSLVGQKVRSILSRITGTGGTVEDPGLLK